MRPLIEAPCDCCSKAIVTSAWNVPEFCHDDCTNGWLSDRSVWSCRLVGGGRGCAGRLLVGAASLQDDHLSGCRRFGGYQLVEIVSRRDR